MKPIAVHIHIYYPELWPEIRDYLKKLSVFPLILFVTMPTKHESVVADLEASEFKYDIQVVANRGYDVGPFFEVLNRLDLDQYSYLVKLHTKRDIPKKSLRLRRFEGSGWRDALLTMLKLHNFKSCVKAFETDKQLGATAYYSLIYRTEPADQDCVNRSKAMLNKLGLPSTGFAFVAGTMFMCRASLLKPLQQLNYTIDDFEVHQQHGITTLAHVMERMLGWVITAQGYKLKDCYTPKYIQLIKNIGAYFYEVILPFVYFRKKLSNNKKKITIFGFSYTRYSKGNGQ